MESSFKVLIIREIQGAIIDFRFWVVLLLCVIIIPLSFYVSVKNYSHNLSDYQQEVQSYRDNANVSSTFMAEGVRPPSPLSIFSQGLDKKMPYKIITSRNGNYKIEYAMPDNKKDLLGEMDFSFIVAFVLSILAIVFTFNSISGDKENGILRIVLSNAVYRRQILLAKLFGNYIVFLVPFLLSILIGLMVVCFSGVIPVFSAELFPAILIMIGLSLIFLFVLFSLGIWVSALTRSSSLSINVLLLIWIILSLVLPKLSPIIGSVVYPVESNSVFEVKKTLLRNSIESEQINEEIELYDNIQAQLPPDEDWRQQTQKANKIYDEQVIPIREKYEKRLALELEQLTGDYTMRCNRQNNLSRNIARLSPINSINNLMAEFSYTGYSEADNFMQHAKTYQAFVKQEVYDKFEHKVYRQTGGNSSYSSRAAGFEDVEIPAPVLDNYKYIGLDKVLQQNWVDITLLCLYGLLFFVCGFVSFLRFDVR